MNRGTGEGKERQERTFMENKAFIAVDLKTRESDETGRTNIVMYRHEECCMRKEIVEALAECCPDKIHELPPMIGLYDTMEINETIELDPDSYMPWIFIPINNIEWLLPFYAY